MFRRVHRLISEEDSDREQKPPYHVGHQALTWVRGLASGMPWEVLPRTVVWYLISLQRWHCGSNHSVLRRKHRIEIPAPVSAGGCDELALSVAAHASPCRCVSCPRISFMKKALCLMLQFIGFLCLFKHKSCWKLFVPELSMFVCIMWGLLMIFATFSWLTLRF